MDVESQDAGSTDEALAGPLKALAHPKRLRLLRFLAAGHSLEEIANELKVARQSAQEHLDRLLESGLVEARRGRGKHGPVTHYVVSTPRVFDVYDRFGARLGVMNATTREDSRMATTMASGPVGSPIGRDAARLVMVHGMRVGQTKLLTGDGPWLIGRDPAATVCLDYDPYVSHRHAEVRRTPKGFELGDALSSNGVFADWERVPRGGALPLVNGTVIGAGRSLVLFRTT